MSKRRIYTLESKKGEPDRLVRANSQAQAFSHVARSTWSARVSTQGDLEVLLTAGTPIEEAQPEQPAEDEPELPCT